MGTVVTATEDDPTAVWETIGRIHSLACSFNSLRYDYGSGYRNGGYSRSNPNIVKVIHLSSSHILLHDFSSSLMKMTMRGTGTDATDFWQLTFCRSRRCQLDDGERNAGRSKGNQEKFLCQPVQTLCAPEQRNTKIKFKEIQTWNTKKCWREVATKRSISANLSGLSALLSQEIHRSNTRNTKIKYKELQSWNTKKCWQEVTTKRDISANMSGLSALPMPTLSWNARN